MTKSLCDIWTALAANPSSPTARAAARAERDALFDHVDTCASCRAATRAASDPVALLEALADDDEGHAYDADRARVWREQRQSQQDDIASAVREVLLPQLSQQAMLKYAEIVSAANDQLGELQLFRSIDAAALTIRSYPPRGQRPVLLMNHEGDVLSGGKTAIPSGSLAREISRTAQVSAPVGSAVVTWLPWALRSVPTLFLGVDAVVRQRDLELRIVERDNTANLHERWRAAAAHVPVSPPATATNLPPVEIRINNIPIPVEDISGRVTFPAKEIYQMSSVPRLEPQVTRMREICASPVPIRRVVEFKNVYARAVKKLDVAAKAKNRSAVAELDIVIDTLAKIVKDE